MSGWKCKHWWKLMTMLHPDKDKSWIRRKKKTDNQGSRWYKKKLWFNYMLKYTETLLRGHSLTVSVIVGVSLHLSWKVGGWRLHSHLSPLLNANTDKHLQISKNTEGKKKQLTSHCIYRNVTSAVSQPPGETPHITMWNLKLCMRGLLIVLLQVHSRLTPTCKDELNNFVRGGEVAITPTSPADSFTLVTPPLLAPPFILHTTPP